MGAISSLYIRIKGDATHFESTMSGVERSLKRSGTQWKRIGGDLTKGLTVPILGLGTAMVRFADDWKGLVEKVETLSPSVARELEDFGSKVQGGINKITQAFEKLDPKTQAVIVKVALLLAALGPLTFAIGQAQRTGAGLIHILMQLPPALVAVKAAALGASAAIGLTGLAGAIAGGGIVIAAALATYGLYKAILEGQASAAEEAARGNRELTASAEELGGALTDIVETRSGVKAEDGLFIGPKAAEHAANLRRELEGIAKVTKGDFIGEFEIGSRGIEGIERATAAARLLRMEMETTDFGQHGGRGSPAGWLDHEWYKPVQDVAVKIGRKTREMTEEFKYLAHYGVDSVSDAIAELATGGEINFRDFAKSIIREIMRIYVRAMLLRTIFRDIGFGSSGGGGGTEAGPGAEPGGYGGYEPEPIFGGVSPAGGQPTAGVGVVINNYGTPIEGDIQVATGGGPSGEKIIYLTIVGNVKKALRSGALRDEMALYGVRRSGAI